MHSTVELNRDDSPSCLGKADSDGFGYLADCCLKRRTRLGMMGCHHGMAARKARARCDSALRCRAASNASETVVRPARQVKGWTKG
jgi:hypothetical protein